MFVLDASVTLAWALEDEASEYATKVLEILSGEDAIVPSLWIAEVANVLNVGLKRARIQKEALFTFTDDLSTLPIIIDRTPNTMGELLRISHLYDVTTYDASYLKVALDRQLPIATLDKVLRLAAEKAGVKLV